MSHKMNKGDNTIKSGVKTTKITTDSNSLISFESVILKTGI